jgi:hypothetical protein
MNDVSEYKNTYIMSNAYSDSTRQMKYQKEQDIATYRIYMFEGGRWKRKQCEKTVWIWYS